MTKTEAKLVPHLLPLERHAWRGVAGSIPDAAFFQWRWRESYIQRGVSRGGVVVRGSRVRCEVFQPREHVGAARGAAGTADGLQLGTHGVAWGGGAGGDAAVLPGAAGAGGGRGDEGG